MCRMLRDSGQGCDGWRGLVYRPKSLPMLFEGILEAYDTVALSLSLSLSLHMCI